MMLSAGQQREKHKNTFQGLTVRPVRLRKHYINSTCQEALAPSGKLFETQLHVGYK